MIAIQMEMPKSCDECRFHNSYFCMATPNGNNVGTRNIMVDTGRPDWCPLMECNAIQSAYILSGYMKECEEEALKEFVKTKLITDIVKCLDEKKMIIFSREDDKYGIDDSVVTAYLNVVVPRINGEDIYERLCYTSVLHSGTKE